MSSEKDFDKLLKDGHGDVVCHPPLFSRFSQADKDRMYVFCQGIDVKRVPTRERFLVRDVLNCLFLFASVEGRVVVDFDFFAAKCGYIRKAVKRGIERLNDMGLLISLRCSLSELDVILKVDWRG